MRLACREQFIRGIFPLHTFSAPARVPYNEWTVICVKGGVHQVLQFGLIFWRADNSVRNRTQGGYVEDPVVCGSVLADQSGPVETEYHREFLQGYVVYNLVVGPLRKGRIDVAERSHSPGGKPR